MKGMLSIKESVTLPREQYDALVTIAQTLLWADDAPKVSFPNTHGYLVPAYHWESMLAAVELLVTPLVIVAPDVAEVEPAV